jgi:hypothetical protein
MKKTLTGVGARARRASPEQGRELHPAPCLDDARRCAPGGAARSRHHSRSHSPLRWAGGSRGPDRASGPRTPGTRADALDPGGRRRSRLSLALPPHPAGLDDARRRRPERPRKRPRHLGGRAAPWHSGALTLLDDGIRRIWRARSSRLAHLLAPRVESAAKRRRVESHFLKLPRRTGARRLVGSGAVRDDRLVPGALRRPVLDLVRRDAHGAGNALRIPLKARPRSHVQDERRVRSGEAPCELARVDSRRVLR